MMTPGLRAMEELSGVSSEAAQLHHAAKNPANTSDEEAPTRSGLAMARPYQEERARNRVPWSSSDD